MTYQQALQALLARRDLQAELAAIQEPDTQEYFQAYRDLEDIDVQLDMSFENIDQAAVAEELDWMRI